VTVHRVAPYHGRPLNFFAWVHQLNLAMLEKGVSLSQRRRLTWYTRMIGWCLCRRGD